MTSAEDELRGREAICMICENVVTSGYFIRGLNGAIICRSCSKRNEREYQEQLEAHWISQGRRIDDANESNGEGEEN